ncbi:phage holin family protein [Anaerobacillus sp. CMMVII]|uniref:phage holin family protein n=1 Tax=Anaerobacillus sp. CMMVII TaxID=2755588 RepID=UPI0021B79166|nr:phage holin family protein [Anaerobacillus sp. CMMVII]MCT8140190.1 phage holin family protein [Anaerobacillus sp. CMMVII]
MRWLIHLLVNSVVLVVVAGYFEGFYLESVSAAIIASVLLSIINILLKPILVILTLPVTVITFGFFLFVINAITLMITASLMGDAFQISGFGMAIFASIIISLLTMLINNFVVKPMQKK